ncbi:TA system VapC family ribonuclease toxin [Rhabdothermincola sp.]|uniref:TA system VapC family ribonuclease toxin n=1 Tax=Rhabdothermincola sp. TaxID=2820405 RepID=UPI002FE301A8
MILVDLNVLIYATDRTSAHHEVARSWLERTISSTETVGIPTAVAIGFVRLTTSHRIMRSPLDAGTSIGVVAGWYRRPNVTAPQPTDRHFDLLAHLLDAVGTAGSLVPDAHLAALAIEHNAQLYSFDQDFQCFSGLRWAVPA